MKAPYRAEEFYGVPPLPFSDRPAAHSPRHLFPRGDAVKCPEMRPWNTPRPVKVATDRQGRPLSLRVGGSTKKVLQILEVWQIDDEWWRKPISRRYAALVLEDGRRVTVYNDLLAGGWFLQEG